MDGDGGLVEIGVGHDDDGVLAAHLAGDFGAALSRLGVERAANFVGAGKGNGAKHRRMDHCFADDRAGADQHIEYPRRQTCFFVDFGQQRRCRRRQLRRLEDHAIARDQGRRRFPHGNGPGKVPRRNQADDTEGRRIV